MPYAHTAACLSGMQRNGLCRRNLISVGMIDKNSTANIQKQLPMIVILILQSTPVTASPIIEEGLD